MLQSRHLSHVGLIVRSVLFVPFLCFVSDHALAAPPIYRVTDLGFLTSGDFSYGWGINSTGQITGYAGDANFTEQAFRTSAQGTLSDTGANLATSYQRSFAWGINDGGQVTGQLFGRAFRTSNTGNLNTATNLGNFSGGDSVGRSINVSGQVAGWGTVYNPITTGKQDHAFRTTAAGTLGDAGADLGTLAGGTYSTAYGINNTGQVTGYGDGNGFFQHAFRTAPTGSLGDGTATDLGTLGGTTSQGLAINASGQVTGFAVTSSGAKHAFRTSSTGKISDPGTDLGALSGGDTKGYSINTSGIVVGQDQNRIAAFYYDTDIYDLNKFLDNSGAGWILKAATGINDNGDITGYGTVNNKFHAFRLTQSAATPEPGSVALLVGMGMTGVSFAIRRKRRK